MVEESYDHSRRWWTLVVLCLSLVIVVVGTPVAQVALPTLVRSSTPATSALQWVSTLTARVRRAAPQQPAHRRPLRRKGALTAGLLIFGGASTCAFLRLLR